jgi:hypothetical protein
VNMSLNTELHKIFGILSQTKMAVKLSSWLHPQKAFHFWQWSFRFEGAQKHSFENLIGCRNGITW